MARPRPLRLRAPAKVNLFLEVLGRRPDGYHELETVFAKLELADELSLVPADRFRLEVDVPSLRGPGNLALRAGEAFRERFGGPAAEITLTKRIPAGAGLGGGSSDAAAVLRALSAWTPVPMQRLQALAASLGADVPVFLRPEPVTVGRGVGERLDPVPTPLRPWVTVVFPGVPSSTAEAFRRLRLPSKKSLTARTYFDKLLASLQAGAPPDRWTGFLFNRLESTVFKSCPESARAKASLESAGAAARLSGSGSCVFAVAPGEGEARRWAREAKAGSRGWKTFVTRVVGSGHR